MGEVPDEVVLEDLCCHFQRMWTLVPPNVRQVVQSMSRCFRRVNSPVLPSEASVELCASLDGPGTTIGTKLSHLQSTVLPLFKNGV